MVRRLAGLLAVAAAVGASGAAAATTSSDGMGTVLLDGAKTFPIVLAKGPEPGTTTPGGGDALAEVASAGATYLKIGPATVAWTAADIEDAKQQNRAAAANNLHTWVNLSTVAQATPDSARDALLDRVVTTLESDAGGPAIAMWKGADEPLWSRIAPDALQFAYCRATGRGTASWCGGEPVLDSDHAWVTIQAPRGTASELATYTPVTDIHGVDVYPVTLAASAPNLHDVGSWTSTIASVTPSRAVWTTLQVCASGSYDSSGPLRAADLRAGAVHALRRDTQRRPQPCLLRWQQPELLDRERPPVRLELELLELRSEAASGRDQLAEPAGTGTRESGHDPDIAGERCDDAGDQPTGQFRRSLGDCSPPRRGHGARDDRWASHSSLHRHGLHRGAVIAVSNGSFTDDFAQWGVHVYHFVPDAPPPPPAPPSLLRWRGCGLGSRHILG